MRKFFWILASTAAIVLVGAAAAQAAPTGQVSTGPAMILKFQTMAPVTGPYVGADNPVRGIAGGGKPWVLKSANGSVTQSGRVFVLVRGLVLADQPSVPAALQGTNPIPYFRAVVSCRSIGAGNTAPVVNVSTGNFTATTTGNARIAAQVSLPDPCIAPVVFVTAPAGTNAWFAATGN